MKKIDLQIYRLKLFVKLQIHNVFHVFYFHNHHKMKDVDSKAHHSVHKITENQREYQIHKFIDSQKESHELQYQVY